MRPICLIAAAVLASSASADITGFNNLSGWTYNQEDAQTPADLPDPGTIYITSTGGSQNRSIYANTRQGFDQFTTSFTYRGDLRVNSGQGMSFILQNAPDGSSTLGGGGSNLGYGGITNSIATTWDIRTNAIGFSTGGVVSGGVFVVGITLGGNNDIDFTLAYDGTFLMMHLVDTVTQVEFTRNFLVGDLSPFLGDDLVYVGFGATSFRSDQTISNFTYSAVPAPGVIGVFAAGLLGAARRRRS